MYWVLSFVNGTTPLFCHGFCDTGEGFASVSRPVFREHATMLFVMLAGIRSRRAPCSFWYYNIGRPQRLHTTLPEKRFLCEWVSVFIWLYSLCRFRIVVYLTRSRILYNNLSTFRRPNSQKQSLTAKPFVISADIQLPAFKQMSSSCIAGFRTGWESNDHIPLPDIM